MARPVPPLVCLHLARVLGVSVDEVERIKREEPARYVALVSREMKATK